MSVVLSQEEIQEEISLGLWESNNLPFRLSSEEETRLFQELERNPENKEIEEEIINRNTRLVKTWARKIKNSHSTNGLTFGDLCQEGVMGLMEAVGKFELTKKCKFSTYATYWIRRAIMMSIDKESKTIRIPTTEAIIVARYKKAEAKLYQELKRFPSSQEIAEEMRIGITKVSLLEKIKDDAISLENPFSKDGDERTLMDTIIDEKADSPSLRAEEEDLKERIKESLSYLSPRENRILTMRFGLENEISSTLKEAGNVFSVTKERARQLQESALEKLRQNPRVRELLE